MSGFKIMHLEGMAHECLKMGMTNKEWIKITSNHISFYRGVRESIKKTMGITNTEWGNMDRYTCHYTLGLDHIVANTGIQYMFSVE